MEVVAAVWYAMAWWLSLSRRDFLFFFRVNLHVKMLLVIIDDRAQSSIHVPMSHECRMKSSLWMSLRQSWNFCQNGKAPASLETSKLGVIVWLISAFAKFSKFRCVIDVVTCKFFMRSLKVSFYFISFSNLVLELSCRSRNKTVPINLKNIA